ncbi:hypothetical protein [Haloferula sp.]|uniref:hypothetical protein n=1 Tax=Haloferula sp. TaxID=2497595 RepID=UPI00329F3613
MKKVPIVLGLATTTYWLIAFLVGWISTFSPVDTPEHDAWWNILPLREPGRWLGLLVYEALEWVTGLNYGVLIGWPLVAALVGTSAILGYSAWFLAILVTSRIARKRHIAAIGQLQNENAEQVEDCDTSQRPC